MEVIFQKLFYNKIMIPKYIEYWLKVIEQMSNDNTYKLAWGRAVIECVVENNSNSEPVCIYFDDISRKMLKYYWNQLFFFNLKQSPYVNKNPYIVRYTDELITMYRTKSGSSIPMWFDEAEKWFSRNDKNSFKLTIKKINTILPQNVAWRFMNTPEGSLPLYSFDKKTKYIVFTNDQIKLLKEYAVIISKLLNYKWSQLLEQYNNSPKIASKVNGISEAKLRRNSLTKYKNELLKEFKDGSPIDFYTGKELSLDDISIDHVIPWSFMYSDDIWNLVVTSKSNNSKKSNSIPTQSVIDKLNKRNIQLSNILTGNIKMELDEAIQNKYVDKFYFQCRI